MGGGTPGLARLVRVLPPKPGGVLIFAPICNILLQLHGFLGCNNGAFDAYLCTFLRAFCAGFQRWVHAARDADGGWVWVRIGVLELHSSIMRFSVVILRNWVAPDFWGGGEAWFWWRWFARLTLFGRSLMLIGG